MSVVNKIIAGSPDRRTRLHDQRGRLISLSRLVRNGPRAVASGLGRVLLGYRPARPWISYDAQARLARLLRPDMRVLEFGSGMSTIWFAGRVAQVVSIEDYRPWHNLVAAQLRERGIGNVDYRLAADPADYFVIPKRLAADGYDLIVIDGKYRDRCAELATQIVRPGGMIYLDNADRDVEFTANGNGEAARQTLLGYAAAQGGTTQSFTDFAPTQFFVQCGLLVTLPR